MFGAIIGLISYLVHFQKFLTHAPGVDLTEFLSTSPNNQLLVELEKALDNKATDEALRWEIADDVKWVAKL